MISFLGCFFLCIILDDNLHDGCVQYDIIVCAIFFSNICLFNFSIQYDIYRYLIEFCVSYIYYVYIAVYNILNVNFYDKFSDRFSSYYHFVKRDHKNFILYQTTTRKNCYLLIYICVLLLCIWYNRLLWLCTLEKLNKKCSCVYTLNIITF